MSSNYALDQAKEANADFIVLYQDNTFARLVPSFFVHFRFLSVSELRTQIENFFVKSQRSLLKFLIYFLQGCDITQKPKGTGSNQKKWPYLNY